MSHAKIGKRNPGDRGQALLHRAAALTRERMRADWERLPEELEPRLIGLEAGLVEQDFQFGDWLSSERRKFRRGLGTTPKAYLTERRMETVKWLLSETDVAVCRIGGFVGYKHCRHFIDAFRRRCAETPEEFRRRRRPTRSERHAERGRVREQLLAPVGGLTTEEAADLVARLEEVFPPADARPAAIPSLLDFAADGDPMLLKAIWRQLECEPAELRGRLIRGHSFFGSPVFFHFLGETSLEEGRRDRRRGVEIARLAVEVLDGAGDELGEAVIDLRALG